MRIIVTAGPTREYIDDVRFISNPSTGRMGYAVAAEAARRGHSVTLLSGPVCLAAPEGVEVREFESVEELYSLVVESLSEADCLVMAAAVGDYRPAERFAGKRKKAASLDLRLVATRDVAKSVAPMKGGRVFVGFAVEAAEALANARRKLEAKSFDMRRSQPAGLLRRGQRRTSRSSFRTARPGPLPARRRRPIAAAILDEVEALFRARKNR